VGVANRGVDLSQELLDLENQYWQALKNKDADAAIGLSDDPCLIACAQGVIRMDKRTLKGMMALAPYTLHTFRISDPGVQLLSEDVAVLTYTVHEELTVKGEPVTMVSADASTWVRRHGRWVCAVHSESIKGDPFGRDRMPSEWISLMRPLPT
jgi:hypothetical protein